MFFVYAELINKENDYHDEIMIGLFTTPEKVITAAGNWVKREREEESTDNICLCAWRAEPDSENIERLDLVYDEEAKHIIRTFRRIERDYPIEIEGE
jgi:hypothetical protein